VKELACRFCAAPLTRVFVDLGMSPPSNAFVTPARAAEPEEFFPLRTYVCDVCHLVQLPQFQTPREIFSEYPYFSSYSTSWLAHVEDYVRTMRDRFSLGSKSLVIELASNDGHLLKFFSAAGIEVLGIEPAANVATAARSSGVPTLSEFFGRKLARELVASGRRANLVVANNVLAHVPDLNDFVAGVAELLAPGGVVTFEFPHLARLIEAGEYDTIYHEHFSYFSLICVRKILAAHQLRVFDVEELTTHGGSLRIFAAKTDSHFTETDNVRRIIDSERAAGFESGAAYEDFESRVKESKRAFVAFLTDAASRGKRVAGYGAPAKATTLLNYCGVGTDLVAFTADKNPYKQGKLIPGVRIPIFPPEKIFETKPDYVVIFPWNIRDEIIQQMADIRSWGGQFVIPIPEAQVLA
jgi:SAM-dependent methyltransferase